MQSQPRIRDRRIFATRSFTAEDCHLDVLFFGFVSVRYVSYSFVSYVLSDAFTPGETMAATLDKTRVGICVLLGHMAGESVIALENRRAKMAFEVLGSDV